MELKQISKWFVLTGTICIWLVKLIIRPYYNTDPGLGFFLGIAPNLLGSFLIPFGACWLFSGKDFLLARIFRVHSSGGLLTVCVLGFGLLVINEYLQLIPVFGRTFDYFDLVFSAFGLGISYLVFGKMYSRTMLRYYPD